MKNARIVDRRAHMGPSAAKDILTEEAFHRMLQLEQNRSRRTHRSFALLTLETSRSLRAGNDFDLLPTILSIVHAATRTSDLAGWMETGASVGVMLTEVQPEKGLAALQQRILSELEKCLTPRQMAGIRFRCAVLPEEISSAAPVSSGSRVNPDLPWDADDRDRQDFASDHKL